MYITNHITLVNGYDHNYRNQTEARDTKLLLRVLVKCQYMLIWRHKYNVIIPQVRHKRMSKTNEVQAHNKKGRTKSITPYTIKKQTIYQSIYNYCPVK